VLDGAVVIGHSLGFDLAVLKREFARAELTWSPPRTLDTRLPKPMETPVGVYCPAESSAPGNFSWR